MTYGWALVLVATIVGILVHIASTPTVLPVENNKSPVGFAVLAQNALNAIIVVVAGAIALLGKLFFG